LYYEFFTQKSMGGSLLISLFAFNAYVMAVVMNNQKSHVMTPGDFVVQPCGTLSMCILTMVRLAVFDGGGLDYTAGILEEQSASSEAYVFMLMFYAILNALILFNGLIGIFGSTFTENDETASSTLTEVLDIDVKMRHFHEETTNKLEFLLGFVDRFDRQFGENSQNDHSRIGHGGGGDDGNGGHNNNNNSNSGGTMAYVTTEGPVYHRASRPRGNSHAQSRSRHPSNAAMEALHSYTGDGIHMNDSTHNPMIQLASENAPFVVDVKPGGLSSTNGGSTRTLASFLDSSTAPDVKDERKNLSSLPSSKALAGFLDSSTAPANKDERKNLSSQPSSRTLAGFLDSSAAPGNNLGSRPPALALDVSSAPGNKDEKKKLSILTKLV
jgi:hypothetical protein